MTDWVRALAVSFAGGWWLAQELKLMDTMETVIRRECGAWDELQAVPSYCKRFARPLVVNEQGEEMHTAARPFCADMRCTCHKDSELWRSYIYQPWFDGLMTIDAAAALFSGR